MRRTAILTAALLACAVVQAQTKDAGLLRSASFAESVPAADSSGMAKRLAEALDRQLAGSCPFVPDHLDFFREAVRETGPLRAAMFTLDRMTRSGRVGTAQHHHFSEDGFIHESVESYLPDKRTLS